MAYVTSQTCPNLKLQPSAQTCSSPSLAYLSTWDRHRLSCLTRTQHGSFHPSTPAPHYHPIQIKAPSPVSSPYNSILNLSFLFFFYYQHPIQATAIVVCLNDCNNLLTCFTASIFDLLKFTLPPEAKPFFKMSHQSPGGVGGGGGGGGLYKQLSVACKYFHYKTET